MVCRQRPQRLHPPVLDEEPGHPHRTFDGRPVIGICNTYSELTPCNAHFRELAEQVRLGVIEAGVFRWSSR
ncbi:dihydroxy-acid dehydratase [Prescottella defluvii]|nr:dihydroxy-acid dehydratase [Prescottella defluvii]